MNFADEVYMYRVTHRLTQSELAERCGVSLVTISNIETKKHKPTKLTRTKIELVMEGSANGHPEKNDTVSGEA